MKICQDKKKVNIHLFPSGRLGNQMFLIAFGLKLIALLKYKEKNFNVIYHITNYADFSQSLALPIKIDKYKVHKLYLHLFSHKSIAKDIFIKRLIYKIWKIIVLEKNNVFNKIKFCKYVNSENFFIRDVDQSYFSVEEVLTTINQNLAQKYDLHDIEKSISDIDVGLHFRFTDFLSSESRASFGYLTDMYYANALKLLNLHKETCIYIFSDDQVEAFNRVKNLGLGHFKFVADFGFNDAEELLFFSKFNNLIISNSTYSWWAGYLAKSTSKVVAPWPLLPGQYNHAARSPFWLKVDSPFE